MERTERESGRVTYRVSRPDWSEIAFTIGLRLGIAVLLALVLTIKLEGLL